MNQQPRSIRKIAVILIAGLIVTTLPLLYFFVWRASDNDYVAASQYIDYMTKTNKTITVELSSIKYPGLINQTTPLKLGALSSNYVKVSDALESNTAIGRDFSVGATFNKHKSTLAEYKQSLLNITQSIKLYVAVLNDCKKVTDIFITGYKEDDFKSLLSTCRTTIDKAESGSKHKPFNDQFLNEYLNETAQYMNAIEKMTKTTTNSETDKAHKDMDAIYDKINDLGTTKLDLGLPNLTNSYSELSSVFASQKKSFFR